MARGGATIRQRCGDVLLLTAIAAVLWSGAVVLTGGFVLRAGDVVLASRDPRRPLLAALVCTIAAAAVLGREAFTRRIERIAGRGEARPARVALAAACVVFVVCAGASTRAVGGSDSSCYGLQAEAFARGDATLPPVIAELPPGVPPAALAPGGFIPSPRNPRQAVPICAPGLALTMAPALAAARDLIFLVVPLFAAMAVWYTFALGEHLAGAVTGAWAAVLVACSPIFLYQSVQPMSDVPATALWIASLALVMRGTVRAFLIGGLCASASVLMRPNMALLVPPILVLLPRDRRAWVAFAGAAVPALAILVPLNVIRYGSPSASGYGSTGVLFAWRHVLPNLARYPRWLLETQTPLPLLALPGLWMLWGRGRQRAVVALGTSILLVFGTYAAYTIFDDWWYIRFLLPAMPLLMVAMVVALLRWLPRPVAHLTCALLAAWSVDTAFARHAFYLRALESRFRLAGAYFARTAPNALGLAVQQSGSLRFHGGRPTLTWDAIEPGGLDAAVGWLQLKGYLPLLVLEDGEEPGFRTRFSGQQYGGLDWPPRAEVHAPVRVRVYDPADRARHLSGARIATEHIR